MDSPKVIVLRAAIVGALLALMPLLVLPPVVAQIDAVFYPADASLLPAPPVAAEEGIVRGQGVGESEQGTAERGEEESCQKPANPAGGDLNRRIETAQRRLQELGACYMLLEASGEEEQTFHFHCQMPVGGSQVYLRPFDATGRDPAATMEQVVAAVEAWRNPAPVVQTAERTTQWK